MGLLLPNHFHVCDNEILAKRESGANEMLK